MHWHRITYWELSLGILSKPYYVATSLAGTIDSVCSITFATLTRHTLTELFYATSLTLASRLTVVSLFLAGHALCRDTETLVHITRRRSENRALRRQIVRLVVCRGILVDDRIEQDGAALRLTTCGWRACQSAVSRLGFGRVYLRACHRRCLGCRAGNVPCSQCHEEGCFLQENDGVRVC